MTGANIKGLIQALPQFREILGRLSVHIWVRGALGQGAWCQRLGGFARLGMLQWVVQGRWRAGRTWRARCALLPHLTVSVLHPAHHTLLKMYPNHPNHSTLVQSPDLVRAQEHHQRARPDCAG